MTLFGVFCMLLFGYGVLSAPNYRPVVLMHGILAGALKNGWRKKREEQRRERRRGACVIAWLVFYLLQTIVLLSFMKGKGGGEGKGRGGGRRRGERRADPFSHAHMR